MLDLVDTFTTALDLVVIVRLFGHRLRPVCQWLTSAAVGYACESVTQMSEAMRLETADRELERRLRGKR